MIAEIREKLCHPGQNHNCVVCRRWCAKHLTQEMSDLPPSRIQYGVVPFENVTIDYFGPVWLKFGCRQRIKVYSVVVTCLVMRALYLDLVTDLSADAFLLTFRRLIMVPIFWVLREK